jgi:hypothetical protein
VLCSHEALYREYSKRMIRSGQHSNGGLVHFVSKPYDALSCLSFQILVETLILQPVRFKDANLSLADAALISLLKLSCFVWEMLRA